MEKILHPAATQGTANYGWLHAKHSFSFANYFDSNSLQGSMLQLLKGTIFAALNKMATSRDTMGIWNTKSVSITTENHNHVLHIETPMK